MAHAKNHDYHILPPSLWPFLAALGAFVMLTGAVFWMKGTSVVAGLPHWSQFALGLRRVVGRRRRQDVGQIHLLRGGERLGFLCRLRVERGQGAGGKQTQR